MFLISPEISPDFMRGFVTVNSSKLELLISVGLFLILIGLVIEAYLEEQRINAGCRCGAAPERSRQPGR